jgi:hypothetical protein
MQRQQHAAHIEKDCPNHHAKLTKNLIFAPSRRDGAPALVVKW